MWRSWHVKNCYIVNAVICPCIWINCSMCKQCLVVHFVFKESHHLCILFPIWIGRFFPFLRWGGSVCMCMQVPRSVGICASFKMLGHYSFVFHQLEEFSKVAFVIILEYWCPIVLALHCQWSQLKWHVWLPIKECSFVLAPIFSWWPNNCEVHQIWNSTYHKLAIMFMVTTVKLWFFT